MGRDDSVTGGEPLKLLPEFAASFYLPPGEGIRDERHDQQRIEVPLSMVPFALLPLLCFLFIVIIIDNDYQSQFNSGYVPQVFP